MAKNIKGDIELIKALKGSSDAYMKAANKVLAKGVLDMHKDTVEKFNKGSRSGRQYKRGNKIHTASAEGEFPKTDRGGTVGSLFFETKVDNKNSVESKFGSKSITGKYLEFKPTSHGGRPWLKPQFDIYSKIIMDELKKASQDVLKSLFKK